MRKDKVIDNYHGTLVADPYRWLEDPKSEDSVAFTKLQNEATESFLSQVPDRDGITRRLNELWDMETYFAPKRVDGKYYYLFNDGKRNQPALYVQDVLSSEGRMVLDPNTWSEDGTVALYNRSFTKDGRLLGYTKSNSGSDWQTISVRDLEQGANLPDTVQWCKFTNIAWLPDASGFYYTRFPEEGSVPPEDQSNYQKVYFHKLGTEQAEDKLIYECKEDKELNVHIDISDDGGFLLMHANHGTSPNNQIFYKPLKSEGPLLPVLTEEDASYQILANDAGVFYVLTTKDAPRGRIIAIDFEHPEQENWRELVSEGRNSIESVKCVNQCLVVISLEDARHKVSLYGFDGGHLREIDLPAMATIAELNGGREDAEMFLTLTSFLFPPTVFRFDFQTGELARLRGPELRFNTDDYETTQVFYPSRDGTKVPMFITHKKGLVKDGNHPLLLTAYGGFNISRTPGFSVSALFWLEQGGVFALANLRGGGEYGEEWHRAGMLESKQNVFDDFISAAEYLVQTGYTSRERLAIQGGSNGGLLVGACMLQRPDMYGAVICQVPVADMLRYHRFTVGRYWTSEYGNADTSQADFLNMYKYSPLHNVRLGAVYPPVLITTADTDDRVVPMHAKKFAATLQEASMGVHPILLRVEAKAGHGHGKPKSKVIEEQRDIFAFLFHHLGVNLI